MNSVHFSGETPRLFAAFLVDDFGDELQVVSIHADCEEFRKVVAFDVWWRLFLLDLRIKDWREGEFDD
jgi:hypothetical protein